VYFFSWHRDIYASNRMTEFGGIEAGGTKFFCAIGSGPGTLRAQEQFPTATPAETLANVLSFFRRNMTETTLSGVGIASFGPLDLSPSSPTFGYITTTPKPGWARFDLAGMVARGLDLPVTLDTDTNGAALAERRWGAAQGLDTFAYVTVGTGIGGGLMSNGTLVHGLMHPEFGHIRIPHDRTADPFQGSCPYHGDCLEGLASGRALEERWHCKPELLPADHEAWELEAQYLALALANLTCTFAPQRIIVGGGVMRQVRLFRLIRNNVQQLLGGYLAVSELASGIDEFIVPPALGDRAGILGALALAQSSAGALGPRR
jgi:fructokinase